MKPLDQTHFDDIAGMSYSNKMARRLLFKRLKALPEGKLIIEENQFSTAFGDTPTEQSITAVIQIRDPSAYRDIVVSGSMGAAEAYIRGKWVSPNLVDVIRLMSKNIDYLNSMDDRRSLFSRWAEKGVHWMNRNTVKNAKKNIAQHYDLSNEFFELFLDPQMMYSICGVRQP